MRYKHDLLMGVRRRALPSDSVTLFLLDDDTRCEYSYLPIRLELTRVHNEVAFAFKNV